MTLATDFCSSFNIDQWYRNDQNHDLESALVTHMYHFGNGANTILYEIWLNAYMNQVFTQLWGPAQPPVELNRVTISGDFTYQTANPCSYATLEITNPGDAIKLGAGIKGGWWALSTLKGFTDWEPINHANNQIHATSLVRTNGISVSLKPGLEAVVTLYQAWCKNVDTRVAIPEFGFLYRFNPADNRVRPFG